MASFERAQVARVVGVEQPPPGGASEAQHAGRARLRHARRVDSRRPALLERRAAPEPLAQPARARPRAALVLRAGEIGAHTDWRQRAFMADIPGEIAREGAQ